MKLFFLSFYQFYFFVHIINFWNDICKKCDSKNINKHIDMKNLQIIKNFGFKSSNIARLFDHAIKSNQICVNYCLNSFNMLEIADHRND